MIDKNTVQKIKDTADIVEVVGDYVNLVRRGSNYMGLCPFHNERTPSFSVNRARNYCYCFSCHKGGSPVSFIMEKEGISYHDALLQLAKKYGIKVEEREMTDAEREAQSRREGMFVANEWAMNYFKENLVEKEEGRNVGLSYFYNRGVTEEAIKQFQLGYAIDNGTDFLQASQAKGFNIDILKTVGLVGTSQQGRDYDKYRGRVIFPILNPSGKVIGFGGRDLKGGPAKYINSPESEIYKKSNELYGIFQAKSAIVREDRCYLVEGYLDVIGMWQSGIKNVVASSGTALTDGQIALIHRFTKNVTLIYDGDAAGIKASLRGIDMLLAHKLDLKVLLLPEGEDPDSWSRKLSPEEFRKYIKDNETDMIQFKARVLMEESEKDPQKRIEAINSVITSLANIPDKVKRDIYIQECARILKISETSISQSTARLRNSILQQEKLKRTHQGLNKDISSGRLENDAAPPEIVPQPSIPAEYAQPSNVASGGFNENNQRNSPASRIITPKTTNLKRNLEWDVMKYCLKSGFIKLLDEVESGAEGGMTTIELVADELSIDGIEFSEPDFHNVFTLILSSIPKYKEDLAAYMHELEKQEDDKRKEGYNEIAQKQLSMAEIEIEEKGLEETIEKWRKEQLDEFAETYPFREFASHENDDLRRLANAALKERHKLSNIYLKNANPAQDDNKLIKLVLNSINVLKNGILDMELQSLLQELRNVKSEDVDNTNRLNTRITEILMIRNRMAKDMGERIICPSRR